MENYKVTQPHPIDEGSTFTTLLAKHLKKDENVAMKILRKKFYTLDDCKRHKEVQVLQSLNHKNVQKMLDLINDKEECLIVLEYFPENVKGVMKKRDNPYSETETKAIMQQVLHGLSFIHTKGFIHRNLRPDVLLCDKEVSIVKISDFSLAKSVDDPLGEYRVDKPCSVGRSGSAELMRWWFVRRAPVPLSLKVSLITCCRYKSPEVLLGATEYTTMIDVWAAGCIMAELLTGKQLFGGDSDSEQMQIICDVLGTLKKSDWPEGDILRRSITYKLPISAASKGLTKVGVDASGEAKSLIMSLLMWAPYKRTSAELAIRHEFFKSDGQFVNNESSQDILHSTRQRLADWRDTVKPDLTRNSYMELEKILATFDNNQSHQARNGKRLTFDGYEEKSPLFGDSTPRSKWDKPREDEDRTTQMNNNLFQSEMTSEQSQGNQLNPQSQGKNPDKNPFEEELKDREEKRFKQNTQSIEPLFSSGGHISNKRNKESPRRNNNNRQSGLFGEEPDLSQSEQEQKQKKAELLKERNYNKYMATHGFRSMKSVLGAQSPIPDEKRTNVEVGRNVGQRDAVRTRPAPARDELTPRIGPSTRRTSVERFSQIDHKAKSEQLMKTNPTKANDRYGNPFMKELLGGMQPDRKPQTKGTDHGSSRGQRLGNSGQYTPSWAENQEIRTH